MVHFKRKTYTNVSDKSVETLVNKIEAYLVKQRKLEKFQKEQLDDGEIFLSGVHNHSVINRLLGLHYSVGCIISKDHGDIYVRIGDPCLVLGTGIIGLNAAQEVYNDMWSIIDDYLLE